MKVCSGCNFIETKNYIMNTYQKTLALFEKGFIGNCTLGILAQSCLGSVAVLAILMHGTSLAQMLQLFLIVCSCMAFNGAVLSQQKPKIVFNILLFSIGFSILFSVLNFMS
jgi:hypothetical protein